MCKVEFKQIGQTMLFVAEKLTDKSFFIRLNKITQVDDPQLVLMYHNLCWAKAKKKEKLKAGNYSKTLADIKVILMENGADPQSSKRKNS